jgi:hypothetical protein
MTRDTTIEKKALVLKNFQKLLRSGKDYTTESMYEEAGKPCFVSGKRAGEMIKDHYRLIISENMVNCFSSIKDKTRPERIDIFSKQFNLCRRESRLIIWYIMRKR